MAFVANSCRYHEDPTSGLGQHSREVVDGTVAPENGALRGNVIRMLRIAHNLAGVVDAQGNANLVPGQHLERALYACLPKERHCLTTKAADHLAIVVDGYRAIAAKGGDLPVLPEPAIALRSVLSNKRHVNR